MLSTAPVIPSLGSAGLDSAHPSPGPWQPQGRFWKQLLPLGARHSSFTATNPRPKGKAPERLLRDLHEALGWP